MDDKEFIKTLLDHTKSSLIIDLHKRMVNIEKRIDNIWKKLEKCQQMREEISNLKSKNNKFEKKLLPSTIKKEIVAKKDFTKNISNNNKIFEDFSDNDIQIKNSSSSSNEIIFGNFDNEDTE